MGKINKNLLFPALSGILLGLAFTFSFWEPLVFIAFIPLFWFLHKSSLSKNTRFAAGFMAGFIYFLFVFQWLWATYPLSDLGMNSKFAAFLAILAVYITGAAVMALSWGGWGLAIDNFRKLRGGIIFIPLAFVFFEYLRSFFFGIFWLGPETHFGFHWTFGNPAYLVGFNKFFLYLAGFGGIYLIAFIVVFLNILGFFLIKYKKKAGGIIFSVLILAIIFLPNAFLSSPVKATGQKFLVTVLQTKNKNAPSSTETLKQLREQIELLKAAVNQEETPRIIIFNEGSDFSQNASLVLGVNEVRDFLSKLSKEPVLIVDSLRARDDFGKIKNRTLYVDTKEGVRGWYDKQLLTPGGEFLPYLFKFGIWLFSAEKTEEFFKQNRFFTKGDTGVAPIKIDNVKIGTLVCADLFSPYLSKKLTRQGADFIIIQASTAIFKGNKTVINQNLKIAQMRAAENKKPLVLAANYGLSYFISANGEVQKITPNQESQILTDEVVLNNKKSLYNKVGDLPFILAGLGVLLVAHFRKRG